LNILTLFAILATMAAAPAANVVRFTLPSGVKVEIVEAPFASSGIKAVGCENAVQVCRLGGKPYGMATGLPKTYVRSIGITYVNATYRLDSADMYDAWGSRPLQKKGGIRYFGGSCSDAKNCVFRGLFGDGASSYVAEWVIFDGVSSRTVLSGDSDLLGLFEKYIDPPVYE
jgi:hypothetical protein